MTKIFLASSFTVVAAQQTLKSSGQQHRVHEG